jgi:hypothetical protein
VSTPGVLFDPDGTRYLNTVSWWDERRGHRRGPAALLAALDHSAIAVL